MADANVASRDSSARNRAIQPHFACFTRSLRPRNDDICSSMKFGSSFR